MLPRLNSYKHHSLDAKKVVEGQLELQKFKKFFPRSLYDKLEQPIWSLLIAEQKINLHKIKSISTDVKKCKLLSHSLLNPYGLIFLKKDLLSFDDYFNEFLKGQSYTFVYLFNENGYKLVSDKIFTIEQFLKDKAADRYTFKLLSNKEVLDAIDNGYLKINDFLKLSAVARTTFINTALKKTDKFQAICGLPPLKMYQSENKENVEKTLLQSSSFKIL